MIVFDRVGKKYDNGHEALRGVSFTLPPGEMTFLTGHSGAGKSTVLKLILAMDRATSGTVSVNGLDLGRASRRDIPALRRGIGMVHQNHHLLFDRSVFDNVALPLVVAGFRQEDVARRVRAALDKVGLLGKENQNPLNLSGGEQQRVGIARAVVNRPPVILADEPTGNLDPQLAAEIMDIFGEFAQVGTTVLIATHDLALIARYRHRLLTLRAGELVRDDGHVG
ncbi:MAG: cell division ATP-binding protein FtsE [Gammaproteobacteria bacterium]